jgi:2-hydroxyglutarate dehydrogenase
VIVVGAGIVGLATARELVLRDPSLDVCVLERELEIAQHQTSSNSGVVHAGIYYAPGSLKARLCVEGSRLLSAFCEESGVDLLRCGKVIVALDASEDARLDELEARGRANGVPGLRRIGARELEEVEPRARGVSALHSPSTAIVDFGAVARALAADLRARGVEVMTGQRVTAVRRHDGGGVTVRSAERELRAGRAIVCAGAWTDRLAVGAGAGADPRTVPFRGAYLRLRPEARHLVRGLIYPVPDPALPFLGVHLTRRVDGEVLLGPTALMAGALDAYRLRRVRGSDLRASLGWPGTWRMMRRHWRTGLRELHLAASRRAMVAACARYVPDLQAGDVVAGPAGVRGQAVGRDGSLVDDFVFGEAGDSLFVRNAPSPAATSSLAIARVIADRLEETRR